MQRLWQVAFGLAVVLAVAALGIGAFIGSGIYNIGADDHHTAVVLGLITQLRDRSIAARAGMIMVPDLDDAGRIAAGGHAYATRCVGCHLAPGVNSSDLRPGLYPHPPNLAQAQPPEARRAFWVIKHGIKMSAMPAWGRTLDDAAIWDLVAFVQKMQQMSPEAYQRLAH
jgi:mono/diheme cytochrome c family protein